MKLAPQLLIPLIIISFFISSVADAADEQTRYEVGMEMAIQSKRDLLLIITGPKWCPACKKMKEDVFDTEKFEKLAEHWVVCKIEIPKRHDHELKEFLEKLNIKAFPTIMLYEPEPEYIKWQRAGYTTIDHLRSWLSPNTTFQAKEAQVSPVSATLGENVGIETAGPTFTPIFRKGMSLPETWSYTFSTYDDNQKAVDIKLYAGSSTQLDKNRLLGEFTYPLETIAPAGVAQIEVNLWLSTSGSLTVMAQERGSNQKRTETFDRIKAVPVP